MIRRVPEGDRTVRQDTVAALADAIRLRIRLRPAHAIDAHTGPVPPPPPWGVLPRGAR